MSTVNWGGVSMTSVRRTKRLYRSQRIHLGVRPEFDDIEKDLDALKDSIAHGNSIEVYDMLASASADTVLLRKGNV